MKKIFAVLICLFASVKLAAGFGTFSNSGKFTSDYINLSVESTLKNNGVILGANGGKITCGQLTGNGFISAPDLTIEADEFEFTGTIECNKGTCTIKTKKPFDQSIFTKKGAGTFVFISDQ